jgi:predicted ATPase/Tfp pilus assembly protein PilF
MNSERWERIQLLFEEALVQPEGVRSAFIESNCGNDRELRDKVILLLAAHERSGGIESLPAVWLGALAGPEPPESAGFATGEQVAGRYLIRRLLGRGGMGEVYEAWDEELLIPVALKTLHLAVNSEEAHKRLKLEGFLARSVWHPNVCRLYDLGMHGEAKGAMWFLTMELLRGETLSKRLQDMGKLPLDSAMRFAEQMATGLGAAHKAGVVHRDFKPSNVMLVSEDGDEQAVVTDFGIARAASQSSAAERDLERQSGPIFGTPAYMAPEQVRGDEVGPAADIYALGIVLYEMVTGTLPFTGGSAMEVAKRRLMEEPPSPRSVVPELDERWEAVILRCLAREPRRRFGQAEEVTEALAGRALAQVETLDLKGRGWHTLPVERDAFVGREKELEELERNLSGTARLVTLMGAGGMGKTRLAVRYGWRSLGDWPGGVWFCDLTEARDTNAIASNVAGSLGVQLGQGDPLEQLGHAIAGRGRCLVILDNFEKVAHHGAATVRRWLERARMARFLVTSREKLSLGDQETLQTVDSLSAETAIELFAARAQWLRPALELVGSEAESAQEIVRLVDGMPLAIELAAARMRVMSAAQIVAQMRKRFQLLTGGRSTRHETLAVAIDGSWELLSPWEQSAWVQCSVFEGGFTLEAAEGVVDLSAWPEAPWVGDAVHSLVEKCLLRTWLPAGGTSEGLPEARFGMYVSLQDYARMKLREAGAAAGETAESAERAAEERHGNWFARYGTQEQVDGLEQHGGVERLRVLGRELENLVAACQRAVSRGNTETALGAYRAASHVLLLRGPYDTVARLGREVMAVMVSPEHRARVLFLLGWADLYSGQMDEAQQHLEAALTIYRELGDRGNEGIVLGTLGILYVNQGRMEEARANYQLGLAIDREVGNRHHQGVALLNLGEWCRRQGQMEEARSHFEAGLGICRSVGSRRIEGMLLHNLGVLHRIQGRMEEARADLEAALAIHREMGNRHAEGIVLNSLGCVYSELGDLEVANTHFQAALTIHREMGRRLMEGFNIGNLGNLHFERGDMEKARAQYEAALAIFREVGNPFGEGEALAVLGTVHLRQGRLEEAREAINLGEEVLRRVGGSLELGMLLCARVELEQRSGTLKAARATLGEADAIAAQVGAGNGSELGRKLAKLRQTLTFLFTR